MRQAMRKMGTIVILAVASLTLTVFGDARDRHQGAAQAVPSLDRDFSPAVVIDIVDPSQAGRVKVQLPSLPGAPQVWARLIIPTGHNALLVLPSVGDEVFVAFENGDVNRPFVLGAIWNGKS